MKNRNDSSSPDFLELFDGGSRDLQLSDLSIVSEDGVLVFENAEQLPSQEAIDQALFLLFLYTNQSTSDPEIALLA